MKNNLIIKIGLGIALGAFLIFLGRIILFSLYMNQVNEGLKELTKSMQTTRIRYERPVRYQRVEAPRRVKILSPIEKAINNAINEYSYNSSPRFYSVPYKGMNIEFNYKWYRIDNKSVCKNLSGNIGKFSKCTSLAKQYFREKCLTMSNINKKTNNKKINIISNMFCNASSSFRPTVARISSSIVASNNKKQTKAEIKMKKCNDLIYDAMISESKAIVEARDKACD